MSDDDRDIDIESDVSLLNTLFFSFIKRYRGFIVKRFVKSIVYIPPQEGDDSDSRQRHSNNTQYYSQVLIKLAIRSLE